MNKHYSISIALLKVCGSNEEAYIQAYCEEDGGGYGKPGNQFTCERIKVYRRRILIKIHVSTSFLSVLTKYSLQQMTRLFGKRQLGRTPSVRQQRLSICCVKSSVYVRPTIFDGDLRHLINHSNDIRSAAEVAHGAKTNDKISSAPSR